MTRVNVVSMTGAEQAKTEDAESRAITGRVKWFDAAKGYGFVVPEDGTNDVLLHISVLREFGQDSLAEGATVVCEVAERPKGVQAVRVVEIDPSTAVAPLQSQGRGERMRPAPVVHDERFVDVSVKWFNRVRGYGFLTRGEGTQDIFIHMEILRHHGILDLGPGQRLRVRIGEGTKGPQAVAVETVDPATAANR